MKASSPPVRLGLVGCGVIARQHAAAISGCDFLELTAVADPVQDRADAIAGEHGGARVYTEAEALIDDPGVDGVILALPSGIRQPIARAALQAGKHLLIEKPPANHVTEIDELSALSGDRVVSFCSSRFAFLPSAEKARELVAAGRLGALRVVRARGLLSLGPPPESPPPAWRHSHALNGGGILANWGCYDLNYLMEATNWSLHPQSVLAQTFAPAPSICEGRVHPDSDAESHAVALIRCAGGEVILLERGEYLPLARETTWQITGEQASLRLQMVPGADSGPSLILDHGDPKAGRREERVLDGPDPAIFNQMPVIDFGRAIREGDSPKTGLPQARILQSITDAIYASAREGRAIELDRPTN